MTRPMKSNVLRSLNPAFSVVTNPNMITTLIDIDLAIAIGEHILASSPQPADQRILAFARKLVKLEEDVTEEPEE